LAVDPILFQFRKRRCNVGTGKINIWIAEGGNPCGISETGGYNVPWVVAIADCRGKTLHWCEQDYINLVTKCGHLEVEVPPGKYILRAAQAMNPEGTWCNLLTDTGVVTVSCGETVCVTLFYSTWSGCHSLWEWTLEEALRVNILGNMTAEVIKPAIEAHRKLREYLKPTDFDREYEKTMGQLVEMARRRR
jgi:hypothetical protein